MDTSATTEVVQPTGMVKVLMPHQLSSVRMMEDLERSQIAIPQYTQEFERDNSTVTFSTTLGVNADITGYGKTVSMIALIVRNRREWNMDEQYLQSTTSPLANGLVHKRIDRIYTRIWPTLVLASPPVLDQWASELSQTNLSVKTVMTKRDLSALRDDPTDDVLLVSPTVFNVLADRYQHRAWRRFIFDEPAHVRVSNMKSVIAGFTWFVTATPALLSTPYRKCSSNFMTGIVGRWSEFDHAFKDIILANDPEFVRASFAMPPTQYLTHNCTSAIFSSLSNIRDVVSPAIIEMVSADDVGGAIRALGGNATDDLVGLLKSRKQEEINDAQLKVDKYARQVLEGRENQKFLKEKWEKRVLDKKEELRKIDDTIRIRMNQDCPICSDPLSNPVVEPSCQNLFCGACLVKWMHHRQTCPLCRAKVVLTDLVVETSSEPKSPSVSTAKWDILASLILNKPHGKFVVFSEFQASFDVVRRTLQSHSISYSEIAGDTKSQLSAISSFKRGCSQVIFLRSTENGAGINLQCATDLVFYHEVSPLVEHQVVGRANRIGRTEALTVHTLVSI